jgi:thiosulfate dehydrogenase
LLKGSYISLSSELRIKTHLNKEFAMNKHRIFSPSMLKICISVVAAGGLLVGAMATALADEASIARGGRLYDKWWNENGAEKPADTHPAYPGKNYKGDATWRCKECHGWDMQGKDGAYSKGKHATGIKGVKDSAGKDPAAIAAIIRDDTHRYTPAMLTDADVADLANFVANGQIDMTQYIEYPSFKSKGDAAKGKVYFDTICAGCHGTDGKKVADADPIGTVAGNGPEMMMKVLNGQPKEPMPALRALDRQIVTDIVAHLQTLPR